MSSSVRLGFQMRAQTTGTGGMGEGGSDQCSVISIQYSVFSDR